MQPFKVFPRKTNIKNYFHRLILFKSKDEEHERLVLGWNAKRILTKINYRIHTDAIQKHIIPEKITKNEAKIIFAVVLEICLAVPLNF